MRAMTRCASVLGLMLLGGCGSLTLEEMEAPTLWMSASPNANPGTIKELLITLGDDGEDCPDLSSQTQAFLNDIEVPMRGEAGGWRDGSFLGTSAHCAPTTFAASGTLPTTESVTRIRMTEGTRTLHAEIQNLCTTRTVKVVLPADGVLRAGQEAELEWQPATDELLVNRLSLSARSTRHTLTLDDGSLRVEGNRIRFRVPPLDPSDTGGTREVILHSSEDKLYRDQVTRCEGFVKCRFECWYAKTPQFFEVTVQP